MKLEQDLAAWMAERPDWQKAVVAGFCQSINLTEENITGIADQLVAGNFPKTTAITAADIPGASESRASVRLGAISEVMGINALLPDQRLTFGDSGLTIVYGDNACGKSGYARLIRQAVTARIKGDLLADVFTQGACDQSATVEYYVDADQGSWYLGDATSRHLSSIRFYDEECGDAYVTTASETSYRPSALTLLDRLSAACDKVQQELTKQLSENMQQRPKLPVLAEGTKAKRFLDSLSADTATTQIDEATKLGDNHDAVLASKLQEVARLQGSNPHKEKVRLAELATHWATVKAYVDSVEDAVNANALDALISEKGGTAALRAAATIASKESFDSEPLPGVGSATWRALWEAARQYSAVEAYREHDFPELSEGAVCVLCQQGLSKDSSDRMQRFETFIKDTTSQEADTAERRLHIRRNRIATLQTIPAGVTTALGRLQAGGEDVISVETWVSLASVIASNFVDWIDGNVQTLPDTPGVCPNMAIEERRNNLIDEAGAIDADTFDAQLKSLSLEVGELQALSQLAAARDNLLAEVQRLVQQAAIESARRLTETKGITRKATALTTEHVTGLVRDQFTRETERLHLRNLTLDPAGGRRNATLEHRPKLLGARENAKINRVLSEGEQTALGLAGFLTEVEFDATMSGVVLDDPVSSLDAGRRSRVAKRLVELARERQVIVFTHEVTFVNALNKSARDQGVGVIERTILRQGNRPGLINQKHPWSVKDIPSRIDWLDAELARMRKERDKLDSEEYTRRAQQWAGRLSQAWERAINLDIVNELVDRGTNEVRPKMFKMLVGISEQDEHDYQSGYGKASEWAPRHDQAPETNFIAPEPDELEPELARFREWVARIKRYKK